jgi:hypothetical protein
MRVSRSTAPLTQDRSNIDEFDYRFEKNGSDERVTIVERIWTLLIDRPSGL